MVSTVQLMSQDAQAPKHVVGVTSRPQSGNRLVQERSYEGSTSLSLQHVLAGYSTAATPRPPQPDLQRYGFFLQCWWW